MRRCKKCRKLKSREYYTLDPSGRSVYKERGGPIWHGKVCGACHTLAVKEKALKTPLRDGICEVCGLVFTRKVINKRFCCQQCYRVHRSRKATTEVEE